MKDKKYLFFIMLAFVFGMVYSVVALFNASAFSEAPQHIARAEKGFWMWIGLGNFSFIGFIVSLYFMGTKDEVKGEAKK